MPEAPGPGSLTQVVGKPNRIYVTGTFAAHSRACAGRFERISGGEAIRT